jgi:GTP cyclohydrolase I
VRVVDAFAHRLTLQEDIGEHVAKSLLLYLSARWAACRVVLEHSCVSARGARRHRTRAETVAFVGDASLRTLALAILGATS